MARRFTDPNLLKREISGRDKYNRPLFKCNNWECNNLTSGKICVSCKSNSKHRQLSRCSNPLNKRKISFVMVN